MLLESALILSLANECQSTVSPEIIKRLITIESGNNPYALAVKGVPIFNQPTTLNEAIASTKQLQQLGFNFSAGLMQINHTNFAQYDLTPETVFDYCKNIKAGSDIFQRCLAQAQSTHPNKERQQQLELAASCYYSGNFTTGFKKEGKKNISYVEKFNQTQPLTPSEIKLKRIQQENKTPTASKNEQLASWDVFGDFPLTNKE